MDKTEELRNILVEQLNARNFNTLEILILAITHSFIDQLIKLPINNIEERMLQGIIKHLRET